MKKANKTAAGMRISIYVTVAEHKKIYDAAKMESDRISNFVRRMILRAIKTGGE